MQRRTEPVQRKTILFGVTDASSLQLLGTLPALMAESGWSVHTVSSCGSLGDMTPPPNTQHHKIKMSRRPSLLSDLVAFVRWCLTLRAIRPDVVSIGTPKASLLGLTASWICGVPIRVYLLRGLRLETERSALRLVLQVAEFATSASATNVIAVSQSLAKAYTELQICNPTKITVLGMGSSHGVDLARFHPNRAQLPDLGFTWQKSSDHEKLPVLGFVGRFSDDKGANTLLTCRRNLLAQGIDHQFVMIGQIESARSVYLQLSDVGQPATWLGNIRNVEDYYQLFDVLLLPTKREGFPNVALEASASGIPVVTTTATGARDAVVDRETGLVVPVGDDAAFSRAVALLLRNKLFRQKLGRAGVLWVSKHYNSTMVERNHLNFYEKLLRES